MPQSEWIPAPPPASALVESLRGVGYSLPTALADLVDNSIAARATRIGIECHWNGSSSWVAITDDGVGMDERQLITAMTLGGRDPREMRAESDLGRFGLGLKTASFSQCRHLTVGSVAGGHPFVAKRWDLDFIQQKGGEWPLLNGIPLGTEDAFHEIRERGHGTTVLWTALDRIPGTDDPDHIKAQDAFLEAIDRTNAYLAMVFHRYVDARTGIRICINGRQVRAWDPFMEFHSATYQRPEEHISGPDGAIKVKGFVLPHKDRLTATEFEEGAGPEGWTAQQGFYVYRNRRMLMAGTWLGLGVGRSWTKDEAHRLARIRLDIANSSDEGWGIDIKKSVARPPQALRKRLRTIAEDLRQEARRVFVHRGTYGNRPTAQDLQPVWQAQTNAKGTIYRIDRDHPVVRRGLEGATADVEQMLRVIEETVPMQRIWLDTTEEKSAGIQPFEGVDPADLQILAESIFRHYRERVGMSAQDAVKRLSQTEPFNLYPEIVDAIAAGTEL